jgi:hypothetical protein
MTKEFVYVKSVGRVPLKETLNQSGFYFFVSLTEICVSSDPAFGFTQKSELPQEVCDIRIMQSVLHESRSNEACPRQRQIAKNTPQDFDFAERNPMEMIVNLL